MKHPKQADRVVEFAYGVAMIVYLVVAIFGYLMYGRDVSDEVWFIPDLTALLI